MKMIVRSYNLDERNWKFLKERAARETLAADGRSVSASDVLNRLVTFEREADERARERARKRASAAKAAPAQVR